MFLNFNKISTNYNMQLTKEQVIEIMNEGEHEDTIRHGWRTSSFVYNGYEFKNVETHGGHEGAGEEYWYVFSVTNGESVVHWKVPGFYASHYGSEADLSDMYEVKPVEKTYIDWEAIK